MKIPHERILHVSLPDTTPERTIQGIDFLEPFNLSNSILMVGEFCSVTPIGSISHSTLVDAWARPTAYPILVVHASNHV